jgi:hypothetical protein
MLIKRHLDYGALTEIFYVELGVGRVVGSKMRLNIAEGNGRRYQIYYGYKQIQLRLPKSELFMVMVFGKPTHCICNTQNRPS